MLCPDAQGVAWSHCRACPRGVCSVAKRTSAGRLCAWMRAKKSKWKCKCLIDSLIVEFTPGSVYMCACCAWSVDSVPLHHIKLLSWFLTTLPRKWVFSLDSYITTDTNGVALVNFSYRKSECPVASVKNYLYICSVFNAI